MDYKFTFKYLGKIPEELYALTDYYVGKSSIDNSEIYLYTFKNRKYYDILLENDSSKIFMESRRIKLEKIIGKIKKNHTQKKDLLFFMTYIQEIDKTKVCSILY